MFVLAEKTHTDEVDGTKVPFFIIEDLGELTEVEVTQYKVTFAEFEFLTFKTKEEANKYKGEKGTINLISSFAKMGMQTRDYDGTKKLFKEYLKD